MRWLLRVYPRAWRERYGAELAELVNDVGLSPRAVADVLRAGLVQRLRHAQGLMNGGEQVVIGPAWRHPTAWAVAAGILVVPTALFVSGSLIAYGLGSPAARSVMDVVAGAMDGWRPLDVFLVLAPLIAFATALAPLLRLERGTTDGQAQALIGVRLRLANLLVAGVALVLGAVLAWYFVGEVLLGLGA